jgi:ribosomal protein S18 acetylase RimI-like enzyme
MADIRLAQQKDVEEISEIIQLALQDNPGVAHIAAALDEPEHMVYVAVEDDRVVGFAAGFITPTPAGQRRWELDLLGVHPDYWNRGIGRAVTQACTEAGRALGAEFAQGLVKMTNVASQKTFAYAGYTLVPERCGLFVTSAHLERDVTAPPDALLIPVTTLTYRGIWLEGLINQQTIEAALAQQTREKRHNIGAVVSLTDITTLHALHAANFDFIGEFQWWQLRW